VREAVANGHRVWDAERWLHLPGEQLVQAWLLPSHELMRLANQFYALVHFPATVAFLVWVWLWRPAFYLGARRSLAVVTALALVIHIAFPLAPPRLVPALGMVDTAALVGPAVYGNPRTDTLTNQFAAMPSLHIGWALVVAVVLIRASRSRWRWLWALHPTATTLVVVATANHYWADGVAAGLLAACAVAFVMVPTDRATQLARAAATAHSPDGEPPGSRGPVPVAAQEEP
jgi:PAP2 superfamily